LHQDIVSVYEKAATDMFKIAVIIIAIALIPVALGVIFVAFNGLLFIIVHMFRGSNSSVNKSPAGRGRVKCDWCGRVTDHARGREGYGEHVMLCLDCVKDKDLGAKEIV